jgi:hypothetical protein
MDRPLRADGFGAAECDDRCDDRFDDRFDGDIGPGRASSSAG